MQLISALFALSLFMVSSCSRWGGRGEKGGGSLKSSPPKIINPPIAPGMYPSDVLYAVEESAQIAQLLPGQGNPLLHGVLSVRLVPPFPQIVPGRRSGER